MRFRGTFPAGRLECGLRRKLSISDTKSQVDLETIMAGNEA